MNQNEIDARDFNGEGQEPTNPVIKTEVGSWLKRAEFKDGQVDWYYRGMMVTAQESDAYEDAYTMGVAQ